MKLRYLKSLVTAILAAATFLAALIIAIQTIWFDSELHEHARDFHGGAKRLEFARAYRNETYHNVPVILFLAVVTLALGVLAIRFYNHAKSDFPD